MLTACAPESRGKVPVVQSALTDALYIACHFIPLEYWGVARLKPGRYSNPSPELLPALVGGGGNLIFKLVANILATQRI